MESAIGQDEIGIYLYVACYNNDAQKNKAFISVTKAMLFNEVAIEMENLGDYAILFTSIKSFYEIKNKMKSGNVQYLLIDIGASFDLERISGFISESQIELIKKITAQKFSKDKSHLNRILAESIEEDNFELSAPVRDIIKKTT